MPANRYYAAPSRTSAGSWNVLDRHAADWCNVEVPHVTQDQAALCAESLNRGLDPWAWLVTAPATARVER
jgi:hypothetical protein